MIFDLNTYIGHWPFRQIRHNTARDLKEYLKEGGIDKACVSSLNAVFYKDCMEGNRELAKEISPYPGTFVPFGIINPAYTNWKADFLECVEKLGFRGLELYPYYHDYKLTDPASVELIKMAAELGIPVHLPCAIANIRQKHWMDTTKNLEISEVKKVLADISEGDLIISNGSSVEIAQELSVVSKGRRGRVLYDFARVEVFNGSFQELLDTVGVDNVIFSSVSPFQYIDPQLVKLEYSGLSDEVREKITSGNLTDLVCGSFQE